MSKSQNPINNYEFLGDRIVKYLFHILQYFFIFCLFMMNFLPETLSIHNLILDGSFPIFDTTFSFSLQICVLITMVVLLLIHKIFSYVGMKPPTQNEISLLRVALLIVLFPLFIWSVYEVFEYFSHNLFNFTNLLSSIAISFIPFAIISVTVFPIIQLIDFADKSRNQNRTGIFIMLFTITMNIFINSFIFLAGGLLLTTFGYKIDLHKYLGILLSKNIKNN